MMVPLCAGAAQISRQKKKIKIKNRRSMYSVLLHKQHSSTTISLLLILTYRELEPLLRPKLGEVTSFKYLGATLCKDGTRQAEIRIRIASVMAPMARLHRIWRYKTTSFASKFKLHMSSVTSILLYGCETWTLLAD